MSSEAQKIANRLNAQKSTGPRSEEGKLRSARNSIRHGMLSKHIVVLEEDPAEFQALLTALHEEWKPVGPTQRILVERIASHQWKLLRVARAEAALFTEFRVELNVNLTDLRREKKPKYACTPTVLESLMSNEEHREIMLMQQYEHREERAMQSCVRQMMTLKKFERENSESNESEPGKDHPSPGLSPGTERGGITDESTPDLPRSTTRLHSWQAEREGRANGANFAANTSENTCFASVEETIIDAPTPVEPEPVHLARELARGGPRLTT